MNLTFNDCVKLICIYFGIKVILPVLISMVFDLFGLALYGDKSNVSRRKKDREKIDSLLADNCRLLEELEEEKAKKQIASKKNRICYQQNGRGLLKQGVSFFAF